MEMDWDSAKRKYLAHSARYHKPSHTERLAFTLAHYEKHTVGDRWNITEEQAQDYITLLMQQEYASNTVRTMASHMKSMWKGLRKGPTPWDGCTLPRPSASRAFALSKEQRDDFLMSALKMDIVLWRFAMLGFFTGMRCGEILNARGSWFDLANNRLVIGGDNTGYTTKTGRRRSISLHDRVAEMMHAHPVKPEYLVIPPSANIRDNGGNRVDYHYWKQAVKLHGGPKFTPHNMRDTWATMLYNITGDILLVTMTGGWSSVEMVRERYVAETTASKAIISLL